VAAIAQGRILIAALASAVPLSSCAEAERDYGSAAAGSGASAGIAAASGAAGATGGGGSGAIGGTGATGAIGGTGATGAIGGTGGAVGGTGGAVGGTGGNGGTGAVGGTGGNGGTGGTAATAGTAGSGGTSSALDPALGLPDPSGTPCSTPGYGTGCPSGQICRISDANAGRCEGCSPCGNLNVSCAKSSDCDILFQCYAGKCTNICPLGTSYCGSVADCLDVGHATHGVCKPY
jgi:hypothetical protein